MKIFYGYKNIEKLDDPVACIGIFDGVHLGHKKVIQRVLNARTKKRDKIIITFDPHPQVILNPKKELPRIMSLEHRLFIFEKMGIDAAVVIKFTDFIASMTPEDFVKKVLLSIGTKTVYVGENFHFGRGKTGNVKSFQEIGEKCGVDVRIVYSVKKGAKTVSSTWLRQLISSGRIEKAAELLRRPASVYGEVVKGESRGRELGIPTANVDPHHEVSPPPGVYAAKTDVDGKLYDGVVNVGFKPTFYGGRLNKRKEPNIEVHLIDFKGDLYGKRVEIFFVKRLRRERPFKSGDLLVNQIKKDIQQAYGFLHSKEISSKIRRYKNL